MSEEKIIKYSFAGLSGIISFITGNFTPLLYLLLFFELCDYLTGIISASQKGGISSFDALKGLVKKLCYFFVVAVGFGFDFMLLEFSRIIGMEFEIPAIFGVLTVGYLLSMELISVLENLEEIGIHLPFLTKRLKAFKDKITEKADE